MSGLKVVALLEEIGEQVLYTNRAIFKETGRAPRLTVLIDTDVFKEMLSSLYIDHGHGYIPGSADIIEIQSIYGYPVESVIFMDEPDTIYKIVQTHITGAKHEFYERS